MSGKVYVVTTGSYSDYRIEAIFTDKDRAESYLSGLSRNDDPDMEEYDLDPAEPGQRVPAGYSLFRVRMFDTGTVSEVYQELESCQFMEDEKPEWEIYETAYKDRRLMLFAHVLARSENHAVKIVNERRASLIASGYWRNGFKGSDFAEVPFNPEEDGGIHEEPDDALTTTLEFPQAPFPAIRIEDEEGDQSFES